jgi:hypothetical protein
MIREGALAFIRSRRRLVNRNGARWLTQNTVSTPAAVAVSVVEWMPALLTSTSMRGCRSRTTAAAARTLSRSRKSAITMSTRTRWIFASSSRIGSALARLRHTMTMSAPPRARRRTAASPTPEVDPATTHSFPRIEASVVF